MQYQTGTKKVAVFVRFEVHQIENWLVSVRLQLKVNQVTASGPQGEEGLLNVKITNAHGKKFLV